jgi:hypothetical protein
MQLFDALQSMRKLSDQGASFSFTFMSYSRSRQRSHGIIEVRHARLKPRAREASYEHSDIIEEYIDLDTGEARRFYQPTLMFFNGKKITLS